MYWVEMGEKGASVVGWEDDIMLQRPVRAGARNEDLRTLGDWGCRGGWEEEVN